MTPENARRLGVAAAAVGVALVVVGAVLAVVGYRDTGGPQGAVRGYFQALADGDAPRALAWGTVPAGPRTLLTSTVLAEQQRIAPIRGLVVGEPRRSGDRAQVPVAYRLGFVTGDVAVRQTIGVVDRGGDWRLTAVAVPVEIVLSAAAKRARVAHMPVPTGTVLAFPGAVPVSFDSPYLALDGADAQVRAGTLDVDVVVSPAGRAAAVAAVRTALASCAARPAVTCPLPGQRYVPGSLRGTTTGGRYTVTLAGSADGLIDVRGTATFRGAYRELTFAGLARAGTGTVTLAVHAQAWAVAPLRMRWQP